MCHSILGNLPRLKRRLSPVGWRRLNPFFSGIYTVYFMKQNPLLTESYHVVDTMIQHIVDLPDGYIWWRSLPKKGRHAAKTVRRLWAVQSIKAFFPATLLRAMLLACIDGNGVPDSRGSALFTWVLKNIYCGHTEQMYKDWFSLQQGVKK